MSRDQAVIQGDRTPAWEKAIALMGLAIVLSAVCYLSWLALTEKKTPPRIAIEVKKISPQQHGYLVQVEVSNDGSETVADLQIEGRLKRSQTDVETAQARLDYVPSHSKRDAGLFFTRKPELNQLTLQPKGYQEP